MIQVGISENEDLNKLEDEQNLDDKFYAKVEVLNDLEQRLASISENNDLE